MTFDPTKPVQTRDGRPVRILCTDAKGTQPIVGLVDHAGMVDTVQTWGVDGSYVDTRAKRCLDLVNVKTKRQGWVNVYEVADDGRIISGSLYFSEEVARYASKRTPGPAFAIAVPFEWEE